MMKLHIQYLTLSLFFSFLLAAGSVFAQPVQLPDIFSDNMVLQQQTNVKFYGYAADTQQEVKVVPGWSGDTLRTVSASNVEWSVDLSTPESGGPYDIAVISEGEKMVVEDVMIGEVWLCSGQSNMEMNADWHPEYYEKDIDAADNREIRFFRIDRRSAPYPQREVRGSWVVSSPSSMRTFSLAGYYFGQSLNKKLNRPIGLIQAAWGGTPVETWTPIEVFNEHTELAVSAAKLQPVPWCPVRPAVTYNAMIHPLIPFPIAGTIWYQGEANTSNPTTYEQTFSKMITTWRRLWDREFPFYFVQIAPFTYETPLSAALVREKQLQTYRNVSNTGMVVTTDITGDTTNIHPKNKQDVGERLARWALAKTYGVEGVSYSGPIFQSMEVDGNKAILYFDFAEQGLVKKGEQLKTFEIAGPNREFVEAEARIKGKTVVVSSPEINQPAAVRMGFSNAAVPNLFNKAGLPASPFRTDDWFVGNQ